MKIDYRTHIEERLLPFWERAFDREYGGVFTCFDNRGETLASRDKYVWSQGRVVWLLGRLLPMIRKGRIEADESLYRDQLERSGHFLIKNAFLETGSVAWLLEQDGAVKTEPNEPADKSIYADCFVVIGLAQGGATLNRSDWIDRACSLYDSIVERIESGTYRTDPYPIPEAYEAHSIPMILLNVAQTLADALGEVKRKDESEAYQEAAVEWMEQILSRFLRPDGRILEMRSTPDAQQNTLLGRHVNPGHALESIWFILDTARNTGRDELIPKASRAALYALERGWDKIHGGIYRFVDESGYDPIGDKIGTPMESLILETWSTKLWWPHSEALYTTRLLWTLTGEPHFREWLNRLESYVFSTFPHPDPTVGEWIQIRNRQGEPLEKVVALPVKDPFHILRNMICILDLLDQQVHESKP
ncbi:MAG: AGE family epimerase/isomerase [Balneolaceae bacterium]